MLHWERKDGSRPQDGNPRQRKRKLKADTEGPRTGKTDEISRRRTSLKTVYQTTAALLGQAKCSSRQCKENRNTTSTNQERGLEENKSNQVILSFS